MTQPSRRRVALAAWSLLPGLLAVALFLFWAAADAGYAPTVWYPGALFVLGLALLVVHGRGGALPGLSRTGRLALGFLCAFTLWSFLSIAWADVRGEAWDGANRSLLYLTVFALFALWRWRGAEAAALLGLYSVGVAAIGAAGFLEAVASVEPGGFFVQGRYAGPAGYPNASCALFLTAFWPAIFLASRRETAIPLRGLMLAAAGLLLELAVLPQSRASLFVFPVALVLYVILVPGRARSIIALAPVLAVAFAFRGPLLDLYGVIESGDAGPVLADARSAIIRSFVLLAAAGCALGVADRAIRLSERSVRRGRALVGVAAVAGFAAAGALFVAAVGSPFARAASAWGEFTAGQTSAGGSTYFASGFGSNRYDFWRVALGEFRRSPATGIGADNFAVPYLRERRSGEEPLYPHSLEVQVLSQTGIVGALLLAGFFATALAAAWRARRRLGAFGRAVSVAALVTVAYWFLHASVDWFWELPALGAPAVAWLGMAVALVPADPSPVGKSPFKAIRRPRPARLALGAVAAVAVCACAASYGLPWLAARATDEAAASWRSDPAAAFQGLERARRLNFLDDRPDLIAGAIAARIDDRVRMRAGFLRALERNPTSWYARLELALVDALDGDRSAALRRLEEAQRLNPSEPVIRLLARKVQLGEDVSAYEVDRLFLERVDQRRT